ncbi:MAG: hypothetical protein V9G12_07180 [Microthrixaceae bacterium]
MISAGGMEFVNTTTQPTRSSATSSLISTSAKSGRPYVSNKARSTCRSRVGSPTLSSTTTTRSANVASIAATPATVIS